jgi:hypothetical protein
MEFRGEMPTKISIYKCHLSCPVKLVAFVKAKTPVNDQSLKM